MTSILDRLEKFSFEAKKNACRLCRKDYKKVVKDAQIKTKNYLDGLCLDCMDESNPVTENADTDYWNHNTLAASNFVRCRSKHNEPTWYFSFMGRREDMVRFQRDKRNQRVRYFGYSSD